MTYTVTQEGVQALRRLSDELMESVPAIKEAIAGLIAAVEEHPATLGPHYAEIFQIVEQMEEPLNAAAAPVECLSGLLCEIADAYQEVIDFDPYAHNVSTLTTAESAAAIGAAAAVGAVSSAVGLGGGCAAESSNSVSEEAKELLRMGVNRVELDNCTPQNRQAVLSAVQTMFQAHPELRGQVSEIICRPMQDRVYASYGPTSIGSRFGGSLKLNSDYFSKADLAEDLALKSRMGWFVPNATPKSIVIHELGHGLHLEMCALDCGVKNGSVPNFEDRSKVVKEYMDDVHAQEIVEEACTKLGIEFDSNEFGSSLSNYGSYNYGEAIAEAVAEVKGGSNPRPLAQEIYAGVCSKLKKLRGQK